MTKKDDYVVDDLVIWWVPKNEVFGLPGFSDYPGFWVTQNPMIDYDDELGRVGNQVFVRPWLKSH